MTRLCYPCQIGAEGRQYRCPGGLHEATEFIDNFEFARSSTPAGRFVLPPHQTDRPLANLVRPVEARLDIRTEHL